MSALSETILCFAHFFSSSQSIFSPRPHHSGLRTTTVMNYHPLLSLPPGYLVPIIHPQVSSFQQILSALPDLLYALIIKLYANNHCYYEIFVCSLLIY
jgi:hypothetical protein